MSQYDETIESVERIQKFQSSSLPRVAELGTTLNFTDAVEPAERLIRLYQRISLEALKDFPEVQLTQIKNVADSNYRLFSQILEFNFQTQSNPQDTKETYISQLANAYQGTFEKLQDVISYSVCRTTDFRTIEHEARGVFQSVKDKTDKITEQLENSKEEAQKILEEVRNVAAEQGVSQQAIYFKNESESHKESSKYWETKTKWMTIILVSVSITFLLLDKWEFLSPKNSFEAIQFAVSKVFIFATLTYLLYLCGKNFLSHKHNEIVNRHRQNALMTYQAMVGAASTTEGKEIVLAQAAYCMFSPQETGYIKVVSNENNGSMKTFIDAIPKTTIRYDG